MNFRFLSSLSPSSSLQPLSPASQKLTLVYPFRIKNLNALAYLPKKYYLCVEMAGKGLISRMSDECLMKGKSVLSYFGEYQAGMRKFTLARKSLFVIVFLLYLDSSEWQYRTASPSDHLCNQKMFDVLWMMYDVIPPRQVSYICASILSLILLHLRRLTDIAHQSGSHSDEVGQSNIMILWLLLRLYMTLI